MLNENLLLDSTSSISRLNIKDSSFGDRNEQDSGVPFSLSELKWYALRVTYSRELKIKEMLESLGIRSFVPMMWKKVEKAGKSEKKLVPAINNLCFAFSQQDVIYRFIKSFGEKSPVQFIWDKASRKPIVVPEKAMFDFITISESRDEDLIYLTEISDKLKDGQMVKVKDGPFAGVEGKIVRIKKSRRIMVEIPGMLAVASTYVSPSMIEIMQTMTIN